MNFLHSKVSVRSGEAVEVMLQGNAANVMLLDDTNFANYRQGRDFTYYGGHFTRSPAVVVPPRAGAWNVVIDLGGAAGRLSASVGVRPIG